MMYLKQGGVAGQAFVLASATQVLTVGAFRVHMAKSVWAGTSSSLTALTGDSLHLERAVGFSHTLQNLLVPCPHHT